MDEIHCFCLWHSVYALVFYGIKLELQRAIYNLVILCGKRGVKSLARIEVSFNIKLKKLSGWKKGASWKAFLLRRRDLFLPYNRSSFVLFQADFYDVVARLASKVFLFYRRWHNIEPVALSTRKTASTYSGPSPRLRTRPRKSDFAHGRKNRKSREVRSSYVRNVERDSRGPAFDPRYVSLQFHANSHALYWRATIYNFIPARTLRNKRKRPK